MKHVFLAATYNLMSSTILKLCYALNTSPNRIYLIYCAEVNE